MPAKRSAAPSTASEAEAAAASEAEAAFAAEQSLRGTSNDAGGAVEAADTAPVVEPDRLDVRVGALGRADADQVDATMSAVGGVRTDLLVARQSVVGGALANRVEVVQGISRTIVAGTVDLRQSFARTVVANVVRVERATGVGILIARRVEGDVRVLLDWRGAAAFGAAAGLVVGLLRAATRRDRRS